MDQGVHVSVGRNDQVFEAARAGEEVHDAVCSLVQEVCSCLTTATVFHDDLFLASMKIKLFG